MPINAANFLVLGPTSVFVENCRRPSRYVVRSGGNIDQMALTGVLGLEDENPSYIAAATCLTPVVPAAQKRSTYCRYVFMYPSVGQIRLSESCESVWAVWHHFLFIACSQAAVPLLNCLTRSSFGSAPTKPRNLQFDHLE